MRFDSDTGEQQAGLIVRTGQFGDGQDPNVGKGTQFKPGQSGNPKGRPKGPTLSTQIQQMMNDPDFIERLSEKIKEKAGIDVAADPDFQGTPMKAIISLALIEAMNPTEHPDTRNKARTFLGKFGYGTKIDVTSGGKRIEQAPVVISPIAARQADAPTEAEAS